MFVGFGGNKPVLQITPAFVREAYSLLRQSIIHVEQDDIDFDEEDKEIAPENVQPKMSEDDSQDVAMSGGDTEMTEQTYVEQSGTDGSTNTQAQSLVTPKTPQNDGPTSSKRRMVITHDKYMSLQSLIVLHLAAVERETGKGIDRDELIDWYLEMKEEEIQDVDELEYEKELVTKVLRKLVKVRSLCQYHMRSGVLTPSGRQDNYLIQITGDVQNSLPTSMDESSTQGGDVRVFYMVHPSVDADSSSQVA